MTFRPLKQKFRHKPEEGIYGDCHRAALASIFGYEVEQLPNFGHGMPSTGEFNKRVDAWLDQIGIQQVHIPYNDDLAAVLRVTEWYMPGLYVLLGGHSKNGCGHTVVVKDGVIVNDPSLDESGIVAPFPDGLYFITVFQPKDLGLYKTIWEGAHRP